MSFFRISLIFATILAAVGFEIKASDFSHNFSFFCSLKDCFINYIFWRTSLC